MYVCTVITVILFNSFEGHSVHATAGLAADLKGQIIPAYVVHYDFQFRKISAISKLCN